MYWVAEIVGSYLIGYALDSPRLRRSLRARIAAGVLLCLVFAVWSGAYVWQTRKNTALGMTAAKMDFTDPGYVGPVLLYLSFGVLAAVWQTTLYWYVAQETGAY